MAAYSTVYVVRKRAPTEEVSRQNIPVPQEQYWASFENYAEAVAHVRRLERAEIVLNGFPEDLFKQGLAAITSMPEPVFSDWLQDGGIEPPGQTDPSQLPWPAGYQPKKNEKQRHEQHEQHKRATIWVNWWAKLSHGKILTPDQRAHIFDALDRHSFWKNEIVEVTERGNRDSAQSVAYAVILNNWEYDDCFYNGSNEIQTVFRKRGDAIRECARLNGEDPTQRYPEHWNGGPYEYVVVELLINPEEWE